MGNHKRKEDITMTLYKVYKAHPQFGEVYQVYVVALDDKHAEKKARTVYWYGEKCQLITEKVDMTKECIIGADKWSS